MTMLYVNGDSWSFRSRECDHVIWPETVALSVGMDLVNDSLGCGSNSRMIDCAKNRYLYGSKPNLMIFALTAHHRYHLPAPDFGSWVIGPDVALHEHSGEHNDGIRDLFFRHCYSDIDSIYRYYRDIWTIHEFCKTQDIPYLCFQVWDKEISDLDVLADDHTIDEFVLRYHEKGYTAQCYQQAFRNLSRLKPQWNYHEMPMSDLLSLEDYDQTKHPNHSGHQKIAHQVINLIKEYGLL